MVSVEAFFKEVGGILCLSHLPRHSFRALGIPLPTIELIILVQVLFQNVRREKAPKMRRENCCQHTSQIGVGMIIFAINKQKLDRMCLQDEGNRLFSKKGDKKAFSSLKSVRVG